MMDNERVRALARAFLFVPAVGRQRKANSGFLHCAVHGEAVNRFGRNDDGFGGLEKNKQLQLQKRVSPLRGTKNRPTPVEMTDLRS